MKTKLFLPLLFLSTFYIHSAMSQTNEETVILHRDGIENLRTTKDQQMLQAESSPLTSNQIENFKGLSYFPIDINYQVEAQLKLEENQREVSLTTTSGGKIELIKFGTATFNFEGKSYSLTIFQNKNLPEFADNKKQLFIPFTDLTSGNETNEGGRYLPVDEPEEGNTIILDFNKAMNTYSAYNDEYFSIVPLPENVMSQTIVSGERKYEDR